MKKLIIDGYQVIDELLIEPINGVNILVGGGNVGKTTILSAIRLVLIQNQSTKLTHYDYCKTSGKREFKISADFNRVSKLEDIPTDAYVPPNKGIKAATPSISHQTGTADPNYAFRLMATGNTNMELEFENEKAVWMSDEEFQEVMKSLASTYIIGHDYSTREMQFLSTSNNIDSRTSITETSGVEELIEPTAADNVSYQQQPDQVKELNRTLKDFGLPYSVNVTAPLGPLDGNSANLELTDKRLAISLPLPVLGSSIKSTIERVSEVLNQPSGPIRLVDNFECRMDIPTQHIYFDHFIKNKGQALIATSSTEILRISDNSAIWFVGPKGKTGRMEGSRITQHKKFHPSTFFSNLTIIGEGATEVGFVKTLLKITLGKMPEYYGIAVNDGTGHEFTKVLVAQLLNSGHKFGVFVDVERKSYSEEWEEIKGNAGDLIFQWEEGCIEENYILNVPPKYLMDLITHPVKGAQERLRTIAARINFFPDSDTKLTIKLIKAKISEMPEFKNLPPAQREAAVHEKFVQLMIDAATGKIPTQKFKLKDKDFKQHERSWFKSIKGGMELAEKLFTCGVWDAGMNETLKEFLNAIRTEVGLETT